MDEQLKKKLVDLNEEIDDTILKNRVRAVDIVIDMVNQHLRDHNIDAVFKGSVGKTGIIVESSMGNDWQVSYGTTVEIIESKDDENGV